MPNDVLVYDPQKGLGPFDRILLQGASARKSPNELSELTNGVISPAAAAQRVVDILDSRDWLSQAHMRMLLIEDIMALKDHLQKQVNGFGVGASDAVKPLISVLTLIDKTLTADKFDINKAMREISRAQAQLMLQGISLALERSFLELELRYPQILKAELLEVFHAAMPDVVKEIEGKITVVE